MGFSITSWTYNSEKYCLWAINETHIAPVALMLNTEGEGGCIYCLLALWFSLHSCSLLYLKRTSGAPSTYVTFLLGRTGLEIQICLTLFHACHCHLCSLNNFWAPLTLTGSPQFVLMRIPLNLSNQPSGTAVLQISKGAQALKEIGNLRNHSFLGWWRV